MSNDIAAFAGAEGYGAATTGGRGGAVLHVTNLNDSGMGSLRWALEQQSGARTIVFDVGGTISLKSQIMVQNGDVTIAGQTAAGEGITLEGARMRIKADNVIVRGIHFRPGDGAEGQSAGDRDGLMIGTTDRTLTNIIVDHNSFSWAIDENVDINGHVRNITVSNNIIAEGLSNSIHPKGEHSKGLLISNWEGTKGDEDSKITVIGNLFSDNTARNPEVRAGQDVEIVNNYIYNYGLGDFAIGIGGGTGGTLTTSVKVVGNVMTPGLSTVHATRAPIGIDKTGANSTVAVVDNLVSNRAVDTEGNQVQSTLYAGVKKAALSATITDDGKLGSGATVIDSSKVAAWVLGNVGAVNGSGRDTVDTRILAEVANGTGTIVNATAQVQQYKMAYAVGAADTDRDGLPDWFEQLYGLDRAKADHNGDNDRDGYTNIEEYINGLITGFDLGKAKVGVTVSGLAGAILPGAAAAPVVVSGFHAGGTTKIDVGALLTGTLAGGAIGDMVEIAYATGNSYISVGPAGDRKLVAVVDGAHVVLGDLVATAVVTAAGPATSAGAGSAAAAVPVYRYLAGGTGNDSFSIKSDLERITETANGGVDQVTSYVARYTLDANVENLSLKNALAFDGFGNDLANKITGNANANRIEGAAGDDKLYGAEGDDRLHGGTGIDWLQGDAGDDILVGGQGADTLVGGAGRDAFWFGVGDSVATATGAADRITDYGAGDMIVLDGSVVDMTMVAATTIKSAKYADAFAAASKLIAVNKDAALVHGTKDAWLFWDADHDGRVDSGVMLAGAEPRAAQWLVSAPMDTILL